MSEAGETTLVRAEPGPGNAQGRELIFVAGQDVSSWIEVVDRLHASGRRRVGARLFDAAAIDIGAALATKYVGSFRILESHGGVGVAPPGANPPQAIDAVLLIGGDTERISASLLEYVDSRDLAIVAPETDRFWKRLPLYLISIPKAGTHLLFRVAEALGYAPGGLRTQQPVGGHWYYLLNSNAHTSAIEFFRDELQKAPFGNRTHPFMRSPALFNYRNPLDILVSEANYWHIDGNSPLSVLLSPLTFEERLERLLDDRWRLGTIRDRVGSFAAWLDCSNVIPVSFEEMVGESGGGSDEALETLIWSLQLKLQVPGKTSVIRRATSDRSSATFREGKINGWRKKIPAAALERFKALPQDFMQMFGYDASAGADQFTLPSHAMAYRHRPLRVMTSSHYNVPFLVETDYLGYNIVSYMQKFYAVEIAAGEFDLAQLPSDQLAKLISAPNLPSLRGLIQTHCVDGSLNARIKQLIQDSVEQQIARHEQEKSAYTEQSISELVKREVARAERERVPLPAHGSEKPSVIDPGGDERVGPVGPPSAFLGYNLFRRRDAVLALPKNGSVIDPLDYDARNRPGVIASWSGTSVRLRIVWIWLRWAYWDGARI